MLAGVLRMEYTRLSENLISACCSFVVLVFLHGSAMAQTEQIDTPKVLVLTTGGTIAAPVDEPRIEGPALVQAVPEVLNYARVEVEQFSLIGSSKMTPAHWLKLAQRVNALLAAKPDLAGIVITHGTDTMEETAYFLNLTVKSDRPVVLVGSMRSPDEISADGPANLVNAVRVSASKEAIGHGVLVVLNEDISPARDVWKTDNRRVQTFQSSGGGYLGAVDPDGIEFFRRTSWPHTTRTEFDVSSVKQLPGIAILSDFTGIDEQTVIKFGQQRLDGLVIRTFAGGRMSAGMLAGLAELQKKDIPTVVTSRVPGGRIVEQPEYDFPVIIANGQPDNKARILLMLGLTRTTDRHELQRMFDTY
jgi:L-asparaginase type II